MISWIEKHELSRIFHNKHSKFYPDAIYINILRIFLDPYKPIPISGFW